MADPTLTVHNHHTDTITFVLDAETSIDIDSGDDGDLPRAVLVGEAFGEHLIAGRLALVETALADLTTEQRRLARSVVMHLLGNYAGSVLTQHRAMESATEDLAGSRARYNAQHVATKAVLTAGQKMAPGVSRLWNAADHFIDTSMEEAALAAVQTAIAAKDADVPEDADELATWYEERRALDDQLAAAQVRLEEAEAEFEARFEDLFAALEAANTAMSSVAPDSDVGNAIPAW